MNDDAFARARSSFLEGIAHFEALRYSEAERSFQESLALLPGRASTLLNLGATRLKLGRAADALAALDQALAADDAQAEGWMQRGIALGALGRHVDALASLDRALALADGAAAHQHRGRMLAALQRHDDAVPAFERALALDDGHAQGWLQLALSLQALNRRADALAALRRASALAPRDVEIACRLGGQLKDLGLLDEAAAAFQRALDAGGDPAMNGYFLAAAAGRDAPPSAPAAYVARLFDDYAAGFDEHLVGTLGYDAPTRLAALLRAQPPRRFERALDLGCGTGLCASALGAVVKAIDGVDLSAAMLERARALKLYGALDQADIAAHLQRCTQHYDLVVAADVFIYIGALDDVFAGVARVLDRGGLFAFTAERPDDEAIEWQLRPSLRYAHSQRHLRALCDAHGMDVLEAGSQPLREDQRRPIAGWYLVAQRR